MRVSIRQVLANYGVQVTYNKRNDEFTVTHIDTGSTYYTDSPDDALQTGKAMALSHSLATGFAMLDMEH